MEPLENQSAVLEMLAQNEESISRLYLAYAERFREMRDFWEELANEERLHAKWIRILKHMSLERKLSIKPDRFRSAAISTFSSSIENEIASASKIGFNLVNALSIALSIEESLIERKYFEVFESDSVDLKSTLRDLDKATREHASKLREVWENHKPG